MPFSFILIYKTETMAQLKSALIAFFCSAICKNLLCSLEPNSACWLGECDACSNAEKVFPLVKKMCIEKFQHHQWMTGLLSRKEKVSMKINEDSLNLKDNNNVKKLQRVNRTVKVGVLLDKLVESFKETILHVNNKCIQAEAFQAHKESSSRQVVQMDFAISYACEFQHKVR